MSLTIRQLLSALIACDNLDATCVLYNASSVADNDVTDVESLAELSEAGGKYYVIDGISQLNADEVVIAFEAPVPADVDADDELDSDEG